VEIPALRSASADATAGAGPHPGEAGGGNGRGRPPRHLPTVGAGHSL